MADWLIYHEKPITLHSGDKSHWFVDGQAIFNDPNLRESVLACWEKAFRADKRLQIKPYIRGIPKGGLCWAKAFAERVGAVFVEEDTKVPYPGDFTDLVVDDVCTTGRSLTVAQGYHRFVVVDRSDGAWGYLRGGRPYPPVTAWARIDLVLGGA